MAVFLTAAGAFQCVSPNMACVPTKVTHSNASEKSITAASKRKGAARTDKQQTEEDVIRHFGKGEGIAQRSRKYVDKYIQKLSKFTCLVEFASKVTIK